MSNKPITNDAEKQNNASIENNNTWQFSDPIAPPRVKGKVTKNVEGSKFASGFLSTFLESLETTLKGVLGQDKK
jgi:hypothetical protein